MATVPRSPGRPRGGAAVIALASGAVTELVSLLRRGPPFPELRPTEAGVRYRAAARRGIVPLADLYIPPRATGASVVLVHGGAFLFGSRRMRPVRYLASRLCASGIAVCAIDHRLIFRGGRLDEAIDDVCDALDAWRVHARRYQLDAAAISLVGLSAGASLALFAAARRASSVARLACCFGLYQADQLDGPVTRLLPRLLFRTADRVTWRDRSPLGAAQPAAPTLVLHGSDDRLVPVEQARRLAGHRAALGLPTRLVIYPGARHGFFRVRAAAAEAAVAEIIAHVDPSQPAPGHRARAAG